MNPTDIINPTIELAPPKDWNHTTSGKCGSLQIRLELIGDTPCMVSAWRPSTEELEMLKDGANVLLRVAGLSHPPVSVYVGY